MGPGYSEQEEADLRTEFYSSCCAGPGYYYSMGRAVKLRPVRLTCPPPPRFTASIVSRGQAHRLRVWDAAPAWPEA